MSLHIDPFGGQIDAAERTVDRAVSGKWNGRGNPPSKAAAVEWARSMGVEKADAERLITGSSQAAIGKSARDLVAAKKSTPKADPKKPTEASTKASAVDANGDGQISDDLAAQGDAAGIDIFADLPAPGGGDTRGAPLWPFDANEEALAGLTVENRSIVDSIDAGVRNAKSAGLAHARRPERVGARYFEADTLAPLRWSQEQRADLQRLMQQIGLYGDKKIRLGSWGAEDQAIFAEVLAASNVEGTRWVETLAGWRRNPPADLIDKIQGSQPKRPTIQVTNPVDIRQTALDTSRQMIGREADTFAQGLVGQYQGVEAAAQQAGIADQAAGGGGTVTDAPSLGNFAKEQLQRTAPAEVDAYKFLGNFNALMQRLGLAG